MEIRKLGNSDLKITPIGVGAWAMGGGGWEFGWGPQDDKNSLAAINEALDSGINWIDTAAVYGLGHSEIVVGRALKGRITRPYVFTKCSMIWDPAGNIGHSLKATSIRHEVEESLRRLDVDVIDLYQVHWPDPDSGIEEGWTQIARLQEEGKVRYIGVSNFNVHQMRRAEAITPITSLQPPYSLLARDVEEDILPYAHKNNIGVIVYSPMDSGLLAGAMTRARVAQLAPDDWRKRNLNFREPLLTRNLQLVGLLRHERSLHEPGKDTNMIDFKMALRTTVLLVDDDIQQLELRALALTASGFSVLTASSPTQAISLLAHRSARNLDVAVVDYSMPGINGCVLADYLKSRLPNLKIILYSGTVDIPEWEMSSIDFFVPKSEGILSLLTHISECADVRSFFGVVMAQICHA